MYAGGSNLLELWLSSDSNARRLSNAGLVLSKLQTPCLGLDVGQGVPEHGPSARTHDKAKKKSAYILAD